MSLNLNTCTFAGNLTKDPEVRFLQGDRAVANFSIAINRRWKSEDGQPKDEVTYLDLVAYGRTAEIAGQYLSRGRAVAAECRARTESWEKDGQKRSKTVFVVEKLHLMGDGKSERQAGDAAADDAPPPAARRPRPSAGGADDSEPPFNRSDYERMP